MLLPEGGGEWGERVVHLSLIPHPYSSSPSPAPVMAGGENRKMVEIRISLRVYCLGFVMTLNLASKPGPRPLGARGEGGVGAW